MKSFITLGPDYTNRTVRAYGFEENDKIIVAG